MNLYCTGMYVCYRARRPDLIVNLPYLMQSNQSSPPLVGGPQPTKLVHLPLNDESVDMLYGMPRLPKYALV